MAYCDLSIALKLALLGVFLSATTVALGVGGWRALARLRELQVASCVSLSRFAQALRWSSKPQPRPMGLVASVQVFKLNGRLAEGVPAQ